ncbi:MAG: hypothetical protein ISN29_12325 [Gammaproteobacteria bacterium AqS3]|nr:hypothetical protein [Gammaproteobacteria bacterium AqS3]
MRNKLLALFVLFALGLPLPVLACSCVEADLKGQVRSADQVFIGQLHSARLITPEGEDDFPEIEADMQPQDVFKGRVKPGEAVRIRTGLGGGDCGVPMRVGRFYAVFMDRDDDRIGICGGSQEVDLRDMDDWRKRLRRYSR